MIRVDLQEVIELTSSALKEERKRLSEELYEMQTSVSTMPTLKECVAYNQGIRDAAEYILSRNE